MLRAIVFDFDGVIANSEPLHFRAFRDVLAEEGVALTEADYYARYLGFDDVGVFQAIGAARGAWTPTTSAASWRERRCGSKRSSATSRSCFPAPPPRSGARPRRCRSRLPPARCGAEIRRVLERENLVGCFTAIVAAEDTPLSKPAPDPYLRALALLEAACGDEIAASDCVAIEDSRWGLESARAAGLRTVAVTHTYDASALTGAADLVIESLESLDLAALARLCSS